MAIRPVGLTANPSGPSPTTILSITRGGLASMSITVTVSTLPSERPALPGAIGTAVAQQQLRSVLSFCNAPQMNSPEAYIQFKPGLIDGEGQVADESTAAFLHNYMAEFHAFIVRVTKVLPRNP